MSYVTLGTMSRIRGLGEYTKTYSDGKKVTVGYYSNPNLLVFTDQNLKSFYEGLRDADIDFQKTARDIAQLISPLAWVIQQLTFGNLKQADIVNSFSSVKLPTAGLAVLLEVVAGQRPFDAGFRSFLLQFAQDLKLLAATLGIIAGVSSALAAAGLTIPGAQPLVPLMAPLIKLATPAAFLVPVLVSILEGFAKEEVPTRAKFKEMMGMAALAAGKSAPSEETIDKAYNEMLAVRDAAKAAERDAKAKSGIAEDYPPGTQLRLKDAPQTVYQVMGLPTPDNRVPVLYLYGPKEGPEKSDRVHVWLGDPSAYSSLFRVPYVIQSGPNKGKNIQVVSPPEDIYITPGQRVFLKGNPENLFKTVQKVAGRKEVILENIKTKERIKVKTNDVRPAKDTTPEWASYQEQIRLAKAAEEAKKLAAREQARLAKAAEEAKKLAAREAAKQAAREAAKKAVQEAQSSGMDLTAFMQNRMAEDLRAKDLLVAEKQASVDKTKSPQGSSNTLLYALGGAAILGALVLSRSKK